MKSIQQLKAELNATNLLLEQTYAEASAPAIAAMRRALAIKSAIANLEYKLQAAAVEFNEELTNIDQNFQ